MLYVAMAGMALLLSAPWRPRLGRRPLSMDALAPLPMRMAMEENEAVEPLGWCPRIKVGFVGDRGKLSLAIAMPSFSGSPDAPLDRRA